MRRVHRRGARGEPCAEPAPAAQEPFDLEKALAREADDLPAREIRAADWSARAFGAGEPKIEPKEKLVAITIPLGTDSPVERFVYTRCSTRER